MAYYNNFPVTYQNPYYQQPQVQQVQPTQPQTQQPVMQQNNGIIWVQGEAGAKSYLVAPNTTVQLWDSENQIIYLKSADASGMPSMKILDYTIRGNNTPVIEQSFNSDNFIHKEEFNALKSELERLKAEISKLKPQKKGNNDESVIFSNETAE